MFKAKIAKVRNHLMRSLRGLSDGYIFERYPDYAALIQDKRIRIPLTDMGVTDEDRESIGQELVGKDPYCYWLADNGESMDDHFPVVIDFSEDLYALQQSLSRDEFTTFMELCVEEFKNDIVHLPFEDMLICIEGIELPNKHVMRECMIRVRTVTKNYKIKLGEQIDKLLETSLFHGCADEESPEGWHYAPACVPEIHEFFEDRLVYSQTLKWDDEICKWVYSSDDMEAIEQSNNYGKTSMTLTLCLFLFFFKHQRVRYREVEVPVGLVRKRKKRNKEPYTNYVVSSLGDFTSNVYSESTPSGRPTRGTAMHIRRGHYQLWPNHRKLPPHLQKRTWCSSAVVGDPRFGIIIRDYQAHLSEGEEVTPDKLREISRKVNE